MTYLTWLEFLQMLYQLLLPEFQLLGSTASRTRRSTLGKVDTVKKHTRTHQLPVRRHSLSDPGQFWVLPGREHLLGKRTLTADVTVVIPISHTKGYLASYLLRLPCEPWGSGVEKQHLLWSLRRLAPSTWLRNL